MDKDTFQGFLLLFGAALPISVFCSSICFMSAGLLREWWEQPLIFRLISRGDYDPRRPGGKFIVCAILFTEANAFQVLVLFIPAGRPAAGLILGYFGVLGLWFAYVALAAVRARNAHRSLPDDVSDGQPPAVTSRSRYEALIDRLDLEDALESGAFARGETYPRPVGAIEGRSDETTEAEGEPCAVCAVDWQGALILTTKLDVQAAADSFQGALVMGLARALNPQFPVAGSRSPDLVILSRVVRADPGSQLLRWLFVLVGSAVFEVETQVTDKGALVAYVHATGTRRWGLLGGDSEDILADAAKLAGQQAAEQLLAALAIWRLDHP